ncbi:hypothetical protein FHS43_000495 [Streptosporangium becharense]|uniref:DUF998 domain-containing protein n=1 Tax=Streptosporangium becharense TaxID=1816182 RepID=A0A7W9MG51_9ACTN|nr:DUF998 domain-containing protein [Streptosporangium becharense]MBB2909249.1 hypothetical protein [Streptosporangium becharense]MBB5819732.1 hypothetical protein [Streptosporangium becharense]
MRGAARAGLTAVGAGVVVITGLDVARLAEVDPFRRTISEHGLGEHGWIFTLGVILLAAGSVAIGVSLVRGKLAAAWSAGTLALLAWSAGLVVTGWFPKHDWSVGPSLNGSIHRVGSLVAFLSLPLAALIISRPWLRHPEWRAPARIAAWLGLGSLLWVAGIAGAIVLAENSGLAWWQVMPLGLVERGLAATEVAALTALGLWAARRPDATRLDLARTG